MLDNGLLVYALKLRQNINSDKERAFEFSKEENH